jgi:hypothetical protein
MDHFWLVQENHGQFVENISCRGPYPHNSCVCNMPLMCNIEFFMILTFAFLVNIPTGVFFVCVFSKRRSKHLDKIHGICNNRCVKSKGNRKVSDSSFEDSDTEELLLEDFDL